MQFPVGKVLISYVESLFHFALVHIFRSVVSNFTNVMLQRSLYVGPNELQIILFEAKEVR